MWKMFWDHIKEEMDIIVNAPILSSVAFLIAISIGYAITKWRYGKMLDLLKEHCAFLKEKLDGVSSLGQKPKPIPLGHHGAKDAKIKPPSRKSEINRIVMLLKDIDLKLSQMKPEDYLNPLMFDSHPMQLLKKRKELVVQLDKLGHTNP
jgi:hypothetical protein